MNLKDDTLISAVFGEKHYNDQHKCVTEYVMQTYVKGRRMVLTALGGQEFPSISLNCDASVKGRRELACGSIGSEQLMVPTPAQSLAALRSTGETRQSIKKREVSRLKDLADRIVFRAFGPETEVAIDVVAPAHATLPSLEEPGALEHVPSDPTGDATPEAALVPLGAVPPVADPAPKAALVVLPLKKPGKMVCARRLKTRENLQVWNNKLRATGSLNLGMTIAQKDHRVMAPSRDEIRIDLGNEDHRHPDPSHPGTAKWYWFDEKTKTARWDTTEHCAKHLVLSLGLDEHGAGFGAWLALAQHGSDSLFHKEPVHKATNFQNLCFLKVPKALASYMRTTALMRCGKGPFRTRRHGAKITDAGKSVVQHMRMGSERFERLAPFIARDLDIPPEQATNDRRSVFVGMKEQLLQKRPLKHENVDAHNFWSHYKGAEQLDKKWHSLLAAHEERLLLEGYDPWQYMEYLAEKGLGVTDAKSLKKRFEDNMTDVALTVITIKEKNLHAQHTAGTFS